MSEPRITPVARAALLAKALLAGVRRRTLASMQRVVGQVPRAGSRRVASSSSEPRLIRGNSGHG
eukprot:4010189-Pyramimonas_sp.AAC.1